MTAVQATAIAVVGMALGLTLGFMAFNAPEPDTRPPLCSAVIAAAGAPNQPVVTNCHHTQRNSE